MVVQQNMRSRESEIRVESDAKLSCLPASGDRSLKLAYRGTPRFSESGSLDVAAGQAAVDNFCCRVATDGDTLSRDLGGSM